MPFDGGTLALSIFRLPEKLPDDYLKKFASFQAGMLDQVKDEQSIGWVGWRHLLDNVIDEDAAICGGHLHLTMRTAERKIPGALLKAICRREEIAYMKANNSGGVPSKIKKEIKAAAMEKNLMKMPPSISGVPFVVDNNAKTLYLGTVSASQTDNFLAFFLKTVEMEPLPVNLDDMMFRLIKKELSALPAVSFIGKGGDEDVVPGRDFLTWLWWHSEVNGGKVTTQDNGDFEAMIEAPLTFALSEDAQGSAESAVKKGSCPLRSAEVKAAMNVGKKLKKAKITFARANERWTGSFDADKFVFSGLALPEGEEMDFHSRFAERVNYLHIFVDILESYVKLFAETLLAKSWPETEKKIQKWARDRESL